MMLLIRAKTLQKLSNSLPILNLIWSCMDGCTSGCAPIYITLKLVIQMCKLDKSIQGVHPENGMLLHHIFFTLKDGVTPLMVAVQHGFSRAVTVLMKAKPDVNVQDEVKIA